MIGGMYRKHLIRGFAAVQALPSRLGADDAMHPMRCRVMCHLTHFPDEREILFLR